jgi:hypothetical protein
MDADRASPIHILAAAAVGTLLCLVCAGLCLSLMLDPPSGPGSDIGAGMGLGLVLIAYWLFLPLGIAGGVAAVVTAGARRRALPYALLSLSLATVLPPLLAITRALV